MNLNSAQMETTLQNSEFARIQSNIKYLESHFLNYQINHIENEATGMCKYCGTSVLFLEECEAGTKEIQESAAKNIKGGRLLISTLNGLPEEDQQLILGFLSQCLQHHPM